MTDVFKFENVVLSAAGIGITPMASILKSIRYQIEHHPESCPIKRVSLSGTSGPCELQFDTLTQCKVDLLLTLTFLGPFLLE